MSKKTETPKQHAVPAHHQTALRLLLAERAVAQHRYRAEVEALQAVVKANLEARQGAIREYLIQILDEAGLDPHVFGISQNLSQFVVLELPKTTVEPANQPVANVAEAKELSGRENMRIPEVSE
jgi:hypothetical protein